MSEQGFKFTGQTYPGFQAHETRLVTVQQQNSPEKPNLKPAIESVVGGLLIGGVMLVLSSRRLEYSVSMVIDRARRKY